MNDIYPQLIKRQCRWVWWKWFWLNEGWPTNQNTFYHILALLHIHPLPTSATHEYLFQVINDSFYYLILLFFFIIIVITLSRNELCYSTHTATNSSISQHNFVCFRPVCISYNNNNRKWVIIIRYHFEYTNTPKVTVLAYKNAYFNVFLKSSYDSWLFGKVSTKQLQRKNENYEN